MAGEVKFGTNIQIRMNWGDGGCLGIHREITENSGPAQYVGRWEVVTHTNNDYNNKQDMSQWKITSADGKADGTPVAIGDRVHLLNGFAGGGYLDSRGWVALDQPDRQYDEHKKCYVVTSESPTRDAGTGTWTVTVDGAAPGSRNLTEDDVVSLVNGFVAGGSTPGSSGPAGSLVITGDEISDEAFQGFEGPHQYAFTADAAGVIGQTGKWKIVNVSA